ncbi:MAG: type 4a pilus biogenesis protein PilO [Actinomycetota bacterium]
MTDRRPLIMFGVVGLATVAFLVFGLRPQFSKASERRTELSAAQEEERALRGQLAALQDLDADELVRQAAALSAWIPDSPELATFVRKITTATVNAGVDLQQLSPTPPTKLDELDAGAITVTLVVEGRYARIRDLHRRLEGLDRAVKVSGLSMAVSDSAGGAQSPTLQASVVLTMFVDGAPADGTADPAATDPASATPEAPAATQGGS